MSDLSFGDGAHRLSASLDVTAFKGSMQADIEANLSPCLPASMDGTIGRGVKSADIVNGYLVLTFTDGKTLNLGPVVGSNGKDGYSPSASIATIPGGHRVTITDADGAHSFDVMDGTGGGSSDFETLENRPRYGGSLMSSATNIPIVKTNEWDAKYDKPEGGIPASDLAVDAIPEITATKADGVTTIFANGDPIASISDGAKGDTGDPGPKGDAFTYEDFTPEQLAALKGPKGDKGDPGEGVASAFWAVYGVTTSAEIEAAYQAGVPVYCKAGTSDITFLCDRTSATNHSFFTQWGAENRIYTCVNDQWSELKNTLENSEYKVTEIRTADKASNSYYPTEKAAALALAGKSNTDHTHSQYITEETDPTVPSWAKQAAKPTYTASEVGAVPKDSNDKIPLSYIPDSVLGQLEYCGTFTTALPTTVTEPITGITRSIRHGDYLIAAEGVTVSGYTVGDWAVYNGVTSSWDRVDNTDAVQSVNGKTGHLTLTAGDIAFSDGDTFQEKYDSGELKGDPGPQGSAYSSIVVIEANTTLSASHLGKFLNASSKSAITITLPTSSDLPVGAEVEIYHHGSGAVYVQSDESSYIAFDGKSTKSRKLTVPRYGAIGMKKVTSVTWKVSGEAEG